MPSANRGDYDRARDAQRERDRSSSAPATSSRPQARPDVVKTGTGKDTRYMDTRTGQSYAAPSYGALSFRGLTSTDPANVARNRYGREALERMGLGREGGMDRSGIASLVDAPVTPAEPEAPKLTPEELARLGAPTTPMAPLFVAPPMYTPYDQFLQLGPTGGYGSAFMGGPRQPSFDLMDIFAAYPNFGMR